MSEMVHPEFPPRITSNIVDAVFRRFNVPKYQGFFTGGLSKAEVEDLFLLDSFTPPALGITLGAIDLASHGAQRSDQSTVIDLVIVWRLPKRPRDTQDNLRARVIDDIRATLFENYGQLTDENGELITEALTRFQRLEPVRAVPRREPKYLLDRMRVLYESFVGPDFQFEG